MQPVKFTNVFVENHKADPFTIVDGGTMSGTMASSCRRTSTNSMIGFRSMSATGSSGTWTGLRRKRMWRTERKTCSPVPTFCFFFALWPELPNVLLDRSPYDPSSVVTSVCAKSQIRDFDHQEP